MPIIALSSMVSPAAIERGRQAGFHDYVAKFDRPGLIAALKEQTADDQARGVRKLTTMTTKTETIEGTVAEYVTAVIGGQLFGLPISRVQDVFMPERLTRVPLASGEIAGVLNLRGRIVTVVDMRARLGLPKNDDGKPPMAVGVDLRGESYGLLIDQIGEVLRLRRRRPRGKPRQPRSPHGQARRRRPSPRRPAHGRPRRRSRPRNRAGLDGGIRSKAKAQARLEIGNVPFGERGKQRPKMRTCLVVDDSSVIRKVARRILEGLDFQIMEAEDGAKALDACKRAMPEAVLLDWNMPVMDGYEFLGNLRRMPGGDAPKVVFCTTENDVAHIARALHAGANEYIMKPFDKDIVTAKFQEVGLI